MAAEAVRACRQLPRGKAVSGEPGAAAAGGEGGHCGSDAADRMLVLAAPHGCIRRSSIALRAPAA
jgi:hypothetical protein